MEKNKESMNVWKFDLRSVKLQTIKEELNYSINVLEQLTVYIENK